MNAVEKLDAAITKLEALRDAIAPGAWTAIRSQASLGWWVSSSEHGPLLTTGYVGNNDSKPHAEFIVVLHRTVEAQLAILRNALRQSDGSPDEPGAVEDALVLADAILGVSDADVG